MNFSEFLTKTREITTLITELNAAEKSGDEIPILDKALMLKEICDYVKEDLKKFTTHVNNIKGLYHVKVFDEMTEQELGSVDYQKTKIIPEIRKRITVKVGRHPRLDKYLDDRGLGDIHRREETQVSYLKIGELYRDAVENGREVPPDVDIFEQKIIVFKEK